MNTIIHLGLPKTGTTTLQKSLRASFKYLLDKGILYPHNPRSFNFSDHSPLAGLVLPHSLMSRGLRDFYSDEGKVEIKLDKYIAMLSKQRKKHNPSLLLLSTERLGSGIIDSKFLNKIDHLIYPGDVKFVVYVKQPSLRYASSVMESLKGSIQIPKYSPRIMPLVHSYETHFQKGSVTIRVLSKLNPDGGDILTNFVNSFLEQYGGSLDCITRKSDSNTSLSAESMYVLLNYRQTFFAKEDNLYVNNTRKLVSELRAIDHMLKLPKAVLKEEVSERIDYCYDELLLLRDQRGIIIPEIDYTRLEKATFNDIAINYSTLNDLFIIDMQKVKYVIRELRTRMWTQQVCERIAWINSIDRNIK
jgi:hypothetical protein